MDKIDQLLDQRLGADSELEKYKVPVTVLFTDIKDSTKFFETEGDVEGLAMVHLHNKLLFPVIEKMKGVVVKTIGDAIMARFDDPQNGLRAAIGMQKALETHNQGRPAARQIRIRIGLHHGKAILKNNDVYGDTVNTAARVEHETQPSEVRISASLLEAAKAIGAVTQEAGEVELKGKADKVRLLTVDWQAYNQPLKPESNIRNVVIVVAVAAAILIIAIGVRYFKPSTTLPKDAAAILTTTGNQNGGAADVKKSAAVPAENPEAHVTREKLAGILFADDPVRQILAKDGVTGSDALLEGALTGMGPKEFPPDQDVTRAAMALILEELWVRKSGDQTFSKRHSDDPLDKSPFEDVLTTHLAYNAIANANEQNWMKPEGGKFRPADPILRKEVDDALNRFFKNPGK